MYYIGTCFLQRIQISEKFKLTKYEISLLVLLVELLLGLVLFLKILSFNGVRLIFFLT